MAAKKSTPKKSPKKSPAKSPKKSPAKSPKKSPKKSPAKAKTPKKTPVKKTIAKSPKASSPKVDTKGFKDPNAPKRATSAYFVFMNQNRAKIIKDHKLDASKVADVARKAGEVWGKMSDNDKAPYQATADKDKARYDKEIAKYKPDPSKFIAKKGAKGKKVKDPNAPKRASSSYLVFMNKNRAQIIKDHKLDPSKVADAARKGGELWGKMSDKDKAPYQAIADKDKARYEKEMAKYTPP